MIDVVPFTVTLVAGTAPKLTVAVLSKFVPVMVTGVPPEVGPVVGLIAVTVGTGASGGAVETVTLWVIEPIELAKDAFVLVKTASIVYGESVEVSDEVVQVAREGEMVPRVRPVHPGIAAELPSLALSEKVTVPVGAAFVYDEETVALKVTLCPVVDGFADEATIVVVPALVRVTGSSRAGRLTHVS